MICMFDGKCSAVTFKTFDIKTWGIVKVLRWIQKWWLICLATTVDYILGYYIPILILKLIYKCRHACYHSCYCNYVLIQSALLQIRSKSLLFLYLGASFIQPHFEFSADAKWHCLKSIFSNIRATACFVT